MPQEHMCMIQWQNAIEKSDDLTRKVVFIIDNLRGISLGSFVKKNHGIPYYFPMKPK